MTSTEAITFTIARPYRASRGGYYTLSRAAWKAMTSHGFKQEDIENGLTYGRVLYSGKACFFIIGRREVARARKRGIDLRRQEGVHVVCSPEGTILTIYRNHHVRKDWPPRASRRRPWR